MQNLFSAESLRAAAQLVIVLDQHRFGAGVFLTLVAVVVVSLVARQRR